jgi:hypothetical protein
MCRVVHVKASRIIIDRRKSVTIELVGVAGVTCPIVLVQNTPVQHAFSKKNILRTLTFDVRLWNSS